MSHKIKLIIGCVSILAIISIGLFYLNKELPGCFSSNFFSKIKTDEGCFELINYPIQEYSSKLEKENDILSKNFFLYQTIVNTSKDYFKKISPTIQDPNLKILVSAGELLVETDKYYLITYSIISPKLIGINQSLDNNFNKEYGIFKASYEIKNDVNKIEFSGFWLPQEGAGLKEKNFNNLLKTEEYKTIKFK
jgi:hypothetical protein